MYLTSKCQLNCDFCFMNDLIRGSNNSIPVNKALKIIDMFVDNGIESISLLGGEPLLYEEILSICEFIESKKVHFTITTNGILLNEKFLRSLSKFSYLKLAFSVINIKESNNMYGNKMLKNIKKNIGLASKMGIRTSINTVLINQKIEDLVEIVDFCNENNIERYSMATFANVETRAKVTLSINDCINFYLKLSDYVNKNKYNIDLALEGCMIY
ncbi:radical SAM protein [Anaerococcus sp. AGMB09787]|uniref:radical SAM protein n=1 Tax=Anaerococcus sp. AGMB09787 TaxID=2922869 RepID=UPI0024343F1C|nr:radical SAM protein [Anaerococcus sp. AGMB09787]